MTTEATETVTAESNGTPAEDVMAGLRKEVDSLPHDDLTRPLSANILAGLAEINTANEALLDSEDGTGVRDIDAKLKDFVQHTEVKDGKTVKTNDLSEHDSDIVKAVADMERKRQAFKDAQEKSRNLYRTKVLGEEEKTEKFDKDEIESVKQTRKMVQEAVGLLRTYAQSNGKTDFVKWADNLSIPQVGRQGSSTVGQKKPRAYVSVNGEVTDSFGAAATLLAKKENEGVTDKKQHVSFTAGDLTSAWINAAEASEFNFETAKGNSYVVTVKEKEKKSDSK